MVVIATSEAIAKNDSPEPKAGPGGMANPSLGTSDDFEFTIRRVDQQCYRLNGQQSRRTCCRVCPSSVHTPLSVVWAISGFPTSVLVFVVKSPHTLEGVEADGSFLLDDLGNGLASSRGIRLPGGGAS
jgi:hypothetical protein